MAKAMQDQPQIDPGVGQLDPQFEERRKLAETPWEKLTQSQQIERTREVLKRLLERFSYMESEIQKLRNQLHDHTHNENGVAVETKKLSENYYRGLGGAEINRAAGSTTQNYF